MRRTLPLLLALALPVAILVGCGADEATNGQASAVEETAEAKIPITTTSEEARAKYIEGRDMAEKLRALDARPILEEAVAADPNFAAGYLLLAQTAPSNEQFFANLEKAVANVEHASEGERLLIEALQAGVDGRADEQLALLRQTVELFPGDERAHNALGNQLFFARQEYNDAIAHYQRAIEINPEFSPAYNSMGYAARAAGRLEDAERAFQGYIEVLPGEPNPFDSYAEFLMKVGRHEESIEQYRRALEVDPDFVASFVGIANNQMLLGQGDAARETLDELYAVAQNDGVRRQALLWKAASYLHEGNESEAMKTLDERMAIATENADWLAVANDHALIGRTLLETGEPARAAEHIATSNSAVAKADVPAEVKEATIRNNLYNEALVALARGDLEAAKAKAAEFHQAVQGPNVAFEIRNDHELMGRIALAEGNPTGALSHLAQANQQDPRVLLLTAEAEKAAGNAEAAQEMARQAADFNQLAFPLSYVRGQAQAMTTG